MNNSQLTQKLTIFDTTMRDGELAPGVQMNINQKLKLAELLEQMGVDVIEVGYPGVFAKDFDEIRAVSQKIKTPIICGLTNSNPNEIEIVASALERATRARINVFTNVRLIEYSQVSQEKVLEVIRASVSLACHFCPDVQWSAFDAARSQPNFLSQAIEVAIDSGANTITIPDSLGTVAPDEFSELLKTIVNQVPNIEEAAIAIHCHDDLGYALENSLIALNWGARQIECSINGLGARRGNADLARVVRQLSHHQDYRVDVDITLLDKASDLLTQMVS